METAQSWTQWTCCLAHFLIPCSLKKLRNLFVFKKRHRYCPPPVSVVVLKWLLKPLRVDTLCRGDYITEIECEHSVWPRPPLFHCLNLSHSPQCERWPRGFSANDEMPVCEPPSPTSPSPPPTPHHMMAWVGLPLWVTQLWGAVLARPLSPVSEPRLMTADDDPVVFPPSHPPSLPASLQHPFNILFFPPFIYFCYLNRVAVNQ